MDPQGREAIDEDFDEPWQGDGGYGGAADTYSGGDGMDFADNPLFADPLFTPASTAPRAGMRGNSLFDATPGDFAGDAPYSGATAGGTTFTGGMSYGAPGLGSAAAAHRSTGQRQRQSAFFDPDPRLFDSAAEPGGQDMDAGQQQAIVASGDAPEPPTATAGALFPSPDGIQLGASDGRRGAPEDIAFADVLGALMRGEVGAPDAVGRYAAICRARARELRTAAAGQLQRAARYLALRDEANALDDEAATWMLLAHLAGNPDPRFPGGFGGGRPQSTMAADDPQRRSIHQQAADLIAEDEHINRAARVVAWLEALAAQALDDEAALSAAGGGTAGRFGAREGVWAETRLRLAAGVSRSGDQPLVSELDPDAPGRQRRPLHAENVADEERILARLWRLIRAGRVAEARELCLECGQPWRAASLGGGGAFGPTPLGPAAAAADAADPADELADELADQVTRGDMVPRALWRWAALQAADKAAAAAEPARRGPSAGTLEAAVYGALAGHLGAVLPACGGWEDATWALARCWLEATLDHRLAQAAQVEDVDADAGLDADTLSAAVVSGDSGSAAAILREGLAVATGGWPLPRVLARLPRDFTDIFTDEAAADAAAVRAELGQHQRALQAALILQRLQDVADRLVSWILPREGAEGPRPCGPGAMRFAAHFALALRATGLVAEPSWEEDQYDPLQEALNEVLQAYIVHAMESGAGWLVPQLACHLRAGRRHLTYSIFAEELTRRPIADCAAAFAEADAWFGAWQGGDVQPDEMLIIADQIARSTRRSPAGGPGGRAQAARWLTFAEAQAAAAVGHANALARELALGLAAAPGPSAAAAWALMHEVLPSGKPGSLLAMSDAELATLGQLPEAEAAAETRMWAVAFEHERRFQEWQAAHAEAAAAGVPQGGQADALREEGQQLLAALLGVLRSGTLEAALMLQQAEDSPPEVVLIAVPAALVEPDSTEAAEALESGAAYPALQPGDAAAAAEVAQAALQAAVAASPRAATGGVQVSASAPAADSDMAGLLQIRIAADAAAAADVVAALAAGVIKGALPGDAPSAGPLWTINADGSAAVVAATVWRVLAPRIALQCAELRQAVVALGGLADAGAELALLAAGAPPSPPLPGAAAAAADAAAAGVAAPGPGLAAAFSAAELRQLLDWERAAALLAMHHSEAAARTQAAGAN